MNLLQLSTNIPPTLGYCITGPKNVLISWAKMFLHLRSRISIKSSTYCLNEHFYYWSFESSSKYYNNVVLQDLTFGKHRQKLASITKFETLLEKIRTNTTTLLE